MNLTRRSFLRAEGAMLALPFLPSLAAAEGIPEGSVAPRRKLAIVYLPNGIVRRCFFPGEDHVDAPDFIGGFDADRIKNERRVRSAPGVYPLEFTQTLAPLAEHAGDITLLTGLDRSYKDGQDVHAQGASCYLTSLSPALAAERGIAHPNGRTLDQVIGDVVGRETILNTLEISCNGFTAPKEPIEFDNISWYGPGRIAPSIREPQKLYDRLVLRRGFRDHVAAVTDLVRADAGSLARRLARDDRHTLDEFLEMIRDIERRIARLDGLIGEADLRVPKTEILPRGEYIRLQMDLMLTAFRTGITDVCTFMIGPERWDATLMYEGVFDQPVQHHNMTHNQKGEGYRDLQKIDLFHMEQFAYLIRRMKELRESDGRSLLEHSLVAFGAGLGDGATHQYFDLPMILAGTAQGEVRQGRLLRMPAGTHHSNLWLSLARLMGLEIESFSDSTGVISELWA